MTDFITVTGTLGTDPELKVVGDKLSRTTFRMACSERRRTEDGQRWEDSHTNWYSVTCFGRLAENVKGSLEKGQRVIVSGKLRIRTYTRDDNSQGTQVEIIANTAGHDLAFQVAIAAKRASAERNTAEQDAPGPEFPTPDGPDYMASGAVSLTDPSHANVAEDENPMFDAKTGEVVEPAF
ncbi:MAG: single-stranded DNA-binding protein [Gulosibacter sp.]|uniref:single-stranded DNA-binding protein n=1 Tax=Gulosibacter sp. TaxID=2817531 RepID=UPI003F9236FB